MEGVVLCTLGEGRFGKVQCVRRIGDQSSLVAVKQYDRQKAVEMGRVTRILQEKAVLQLLNVTPRLSSLIFRNQCSAPHSLLWPGVTEPIHYKIH